MTTEWGSKIKLALAIFGTVMLVLLIVVVGFIVYAFHFGNQLDKSSKAYVDEAIPSIVTTWSKDELSQRASLQFKQAVSEEEISQLFSKLSNLGALKNYEGSQGQAYMNYTPDKGNVTTAKYVAQATFENGEAKIQVNLIKEDDQWKILRFDVRSPLFNK